MNNEVNPAAARQTELDEKKNITHSVTKKAQSYTKKKPLGFFE